METATSGVGSHSISAGTLLTSGYSVRACVRACFRLCSSEQQALYPRRPETSTVSGHGVCVCVLILVTVPRVAFVFLLYLIVSFLLRTKWRFPC